MKNLYCFLFLFSICRVCFAQTYIQIPFEPDATHPIVSSFNATTNWEKGSVPDSYCSPLNSSVSHLYDWKPYFNPFKINAGRCYDGTYFRMPFFRINSSDATDNDDLLPLQPQGSQTTVDFIPDYLPEDGWELVNKTVGDPTNPIPNPHWIFYNKYQAKLRVFVLITQQFGVANYANICIYFRDGTFASNLLTASKQPMPALDKYVDYRENGNMLCQVINWDNSPDEWIYADFPMTYDPCTCMFKEGSIQVRVMLESQSQLDLGHSHNTKSINNQNVVTTAKAGDPLIASDVAGTETTDLSSFKEFAQSVTDINKAISDIGDPVQSAECSIELDNLFFSDLMTSC